MKLVCCSGAEAERFNRTRDHTTVQCFVCLRPFCLDARDVRAEAEHRPTKMEPRQGRARRWYCSLDCREAARKADSAEVTRRRSQYPSDHGVGAGRATETRDQAQGTLLDEEAS